MLPALYITFFILVIVGVIIVRRRIRANIRRMLMAAPVSEEWQKILEKNVKIYRHLPDDLKAQLHGLINIFLVEKQFVGCQGLEITDEIKLTVAAQACILLLNRKTKYYPRLKMIYIYPHTYVADQDGVRCPRLGESWSSGPVVLSWDSIQGGARNIHDGKNVVFHEFSHRLDQEDGEADGAPILENRSSYKTWAQVLSKEYEKLQGKTRGRRRSGLNKYGSTNPAEFFAVATEAFFEKAKQMKKKQPELYEEFKSYYKVDPAEWKSNS